MAAGIGLTVAGVGTGVYQIGRGIANTPESIKGAVEGKEFDKKTGEYVTYRLLEEA